MRGYIYSTPGIGLDLALNDQGGIAGLGLNIPGFDGVWRTFITTPINGDEFHRAVNALQAAATLDFPNTNKPTLTQIGTIGLVIAADQNTVTLSYTLDRKAFGYPAVDFSPPPPPEVTGTATLSRQA